MMKILFIVRSFSKGGPQPLRFQKIIEFLKDIYEIHVLEIYHGKTNSEYNNGITVHKIEYTKVGKLLNPINNKGKGLFNDNHIPKFRLKARLKKYIRKFFFPDTTIFEKTKLCKYVCELSRLHNYSIIVASGFPYTTMTISKTIRNKLTNIPFIYDIGDPFYNNSQNGFIRNILAKHFELKYLKYVNKLVVNNSETYRHYVENFEDSITASNIEIIEQGIPLELITEIEKSNINNSSLNVNKNIKLVYAGQLYLKLREPFELYSAVNYWNKNKSNKTLELDMYGSFSELFKSKSNQNSFINFKGKVDLSETIKAYFICDIIVFIDNAYGLQTPSKIYEVASIGKPVLFITDRERSPALEVVKNLDHIYICKNNSESILNNIKIINLNVEPNLIYNIRERFSWKNRALQYHKLFNKYS